MASGLVGAALWGAVAALLAMTGFVTYYGAIPYAPPTPGEVPPLRDPTVAAVAAGFALLVGPVVIAGAIVATRCRWWIGAAVGAAVGMACGGVYWLHRPTAAGEYRWAQCQALWTGVGFGAGLAAGRRPAP
jgi:hypothetical protein